jgi:hypothetical protein
MLSRESNNTPETKHASNVWLSVVFDDMGKQIWPKMQAMLIDDFDEC